MRNRQSLIQFLIILFFLSTFACNTPAFHAPLANSSGSSWKPYNPGGGGNDTPNPNPGITPTPTPTPTPAVSHDQVIFQFDGESNDDRFGVAIANLGDVDGDSVNDFVIGISNYDEEPNPYFVGTIADGKIEIYSGQTGLLITEEFYQEPEQRFGQSLANVGDINGDGKTDFAVGAPRTDIDLDGFNGKEIDVGRVYIYSFINSQLVLLRTHDGHVENERLGLSVAAAGDLNGDSTDDYFVGGYQADDVDNLGSVYVFLGNGLELTQIQDADRFDYFGNSIVSLGDINNDTVPDFAVGAPYNDFPLDPQVGEPIEKQNIGRVFLYSGADFSSIDVLGGEEEYHAFGAVLANAGDINGDGVNDLIVGAPHLEPGFANSQQGKVYVFSGADRSLIFQWAGEDNGHFGAAIANAGDTNGDGVNDIIIGEKQAPGNLGKGRAAVFSGADGSLLYNYSPQEGYSYLGTTVCGLGDITGDGFSNFAIAATSSTTVTFSWFIQAPGHVWIY